MTKILFKKLMGGELLVGSVFVCLFAVSALAQSAPSSGQIPAGSSGSISPSQGIGPANTEVSNKILGSALSPDTRQTLQEAMDADDAATSGSAVSGTALELGTGEAAVIDGTTVKRIPYDSVPEPLKKALAAGFY